MYLIVICLRMLYISVFYYTVHSLEIPFFTLSPSSFFILFSVDEFVIMVSLYAIFFIGSAMGQHWVGNVMGLCENAIGCLCLIVPRLADGDG